MAIILLVDDDATVRNAMKRILRTCGAEIQEAGDGAEALELLRGGLKPCIILSDVDMPRLNGLRLAVHVKEEFPSLPVVLISGGGHEQMAEIIGVQYLPKPADVNVIRELVKKTL